MKPPNEKKRFRRYKNLLKGVRETISTLLDGYKLVEKVYKEESEKKIIKIMVLKESYNWK